MMLIQKQIKNLRQLEIQAEEFQYPKDTNSMYAFVHIKNIIRRKIEHMLIYLARNRLKNKRENINRIFWHNQLILTLERIINKFKFESKAIFYLFKPKTQVYMHNDLELNETIINQKINQLVQQKSNHTLCLKCCQNLQIGKSLEVYNQYNNFILFSITNASCQILLQICMGILNTGGGYVLLAPDINQQANIINDGFDQKQINLFTPQVKSYIEYFNNTIKQIKNNNEDEGQQVQIDIAKFDKKKLGQIKQLKYIFQIVIIPKMETYYPFYIQKNKYSFKISKFIKLSSILSKSSITPKKSEYLPSKSLKHTANGLQYIKSNYRQLSTYQFIRKRRIHRKLTPHYNFQCKVYKNTIKIIKKQQKQHKQSQIVDQEVKQVFDILKLQKKYKNHALVFSYNHSGFLKFIEKLWNSGTYKSSIRRIFKSVNQQIFLISHNIESTQTLFGIARQLQQKFGKTQYIFQCSAKIGLKKSVVQRQRDQFFKYMKTNKQNFGVDCPFFFYQKMYEQNYLQYYQDVTLKITKKQKQKYYLESILSFCYFYFRGYRPEYIQKNNTFI